LRLAKACFYFLHLAMLATVSSQFCFSNLVPCGTTKELNPIKFCWYMIATTFGAGTPGPHCWVETPEHHRGYMRKDGSIAERVLFIFFWKHVLSYPLTNMRHERIARYRYPTLCYLHVIIKDHRWLMNSRCHFYHVAETLVMDDECKLQIKSPQTTYYTHDFVWFVIIIIHYYLMFFLMKRNELAHAFRSQVAQWVMEMMIFLYPRLGRFLALLGALPVWHVAAITCEPSSENC